MSPGLLAWYLFPGLLPYASRRGDIPAMPEPNENEQPQDGGNEPPPPVILPPGDDPPEQDPDE